MAKQKAKKSHIANSDTDSENSYPVSQPTNSSSSTSTKKPYVPRFLIIHSEKEGETISSLSPFVVHKTIMSIAGEPKSKETISSLSPFVVHKTIMSIAGEPKSIKNLRSGDLLIQCAKESHEKSLLQMKIFCGLKCSVTPHSSLNTSKGIIRCPALSRVTSDDIKEGMVEQGVTDVRRITVRRDGETKLTNTYVLSFNSPNLPTVVKIGFMQVKVDVYIPNPLRCYHCQVFGHHENKCGRHAVCCNCGEPEHCAPSGVCDKPAKCVNCSGNHPANSKQCPQWEKEKKILKIKCENNLSFPDARKQYEQFYTGQTYASAVKPGTCNKSTQTDNKSTQTDDSFKEYLKKTTEKTQGTKEKRNASPKPGKSNSSHSGPALKGATLEMIKKDEEKKKKEEKDKLKKQQKEERKQQWQKEQAQKEKEQTEKAKQAEKNPYSVFAEKDDEEVNMEEESVVFTDSSSSDHLPKGTLPRLPVTK